MLKAAKIYTLSHLTLFSVSFLPMLILIVYCIKENFIIFLIKGEITSDSRFILALLLISIYFIFILISVFKVLSSSYLMNFKKQLTELQSEIMEQDFLNAYKVAATLYISENWIYCFFTYDAVIIKITDVIWVYEESSGKAGYWYYIHTKNKKKYKLRLWMRSDIQKINDILKERKLPIIIGYNSYKDVMYNDNFPQFKRMASIANKKKSKYSKK